MRKIQTTSALLATDITMMTCLMMMVGPSVIYATSGFMMLASLDIVGCVQQVTAFKAALET